MKCFVPSLVLAIGLGVVGCPSPIPAIVDAGTDAPSRDAGAPPSDAGTDGGPTDAPSTPPDAPAPCDPSDEFGDPVLLPALNTVGANTNASFTDDELVVVWDSTRTPNAGGWDLWTAVRAGRLDAFTNIHRIDGLATGVHDSEGELSDDGLTLYFRRDVPPTDANVLVSTRLDRGVDFATGAPLGGISTTEAVETSPFATRTALYFGHGVGADREIWRAPRVGTGFGTPVPVSELNTAAFEDNPVLSADELRICWASSRSDGGALGDHDVWCASRASPTGTFSSITNVASVNTASRDIPDDMSVDGCRLYLSSERSGTGFAMYVAERGP